MNRPQPQLNTLRYTGKIPYIINPLFTLPLRDTNCKCLMFGKNFQKKRKELAICHGNSRLLQITFHTFRHWKATMEYYKTKDILYVMHLLGHKNIKKH